MKMIGLRGGEVVVGGGCKVNGYLEDVERKWAEMEAEGDELKLGLLL